MMAKHLSFGVESAGVWLTQQHAVLTEIGKNQTSIMELLF